MTTVHLVRHGRTVWHDGNRYAGSSDVALDATGVEQAADLGRWAAGAGLDRIVASDLSRAIVTATAAAEATGLPLTVDARLREMDFGAAEGLMASEQQERFPEERAAFEAAPASSPLPGGESGHVVAARAVAALTDVVRADAAGDDRVLVVAHTTTIRLTLCALLGLPLDEYRRLLPRLDNVAPTTVRLALDGDRLHASLLRYNVPIR